MKQFLEYSRLKVDGNSEAKVIYALFLKKTSS